MGLHILRILTSAFILNTCINYVHAQFGLKAVGDVCVSGLECSSMDCHSGQCRGTVFGRASFVMERFDYSVDFTDKLHVVDQVSLTGTVKTLDYVDHVRKGLTIVSLGRKSLCDDVTGSSIRTPPLVTEKISSFFDMSDGDGSGKCNSFTDAYFDGVVQNDNTWLAVFNDLDSISTRHNRTNALAAPGFDLDETAAVGNLRSYVTNVNIGALTASCGILATKGAVNLEAGATDAEKDRYVNYHLYKSVVTLFKSNPRDATDTVFGLQCIAQEYSLDVAIETSQVAAFSASVDTQAIVEGVEYKSCSSIPYGSCEIAHCESCDDSWGPEHTCSTSTVTNQFQLEVTLKVDKPVGTTVVGVSSEEYGTSRNCFGFGDDYVIENDSDTAQFATVRVRTACLDLSAVIDNGGSGFGIDCNTFNTCTRTDLGLAEASTNYGFMLNLSRTDSGMYQDLFVDLQLDSFTCPAFVVDNDNVVGLSSNLEFWAGQGKNALGAVNPAVRRPLGNYNEAEEIIFSVSLNGTLYHQSMFNLMMKSLTTCRLSSLTTAAQKNCVVNGGTDCAAFSDTVKGCGSDAIGKWADWVAAEAVAGRTVVNPIETAYALVGHKNNGGEVQYGVAADLSTFGFESSRCKSSVNWWMDTTYSPTSTCNTDICTWSIGEDLATAASASYTTGGYKNAMDAFRIDSSIFAVINEEVNWVVEIEAEVEHCHIPSSGRRLLRLVRELPSSVASGRRLLQDARGPENRELTSKKASSFSVTYVAPPTFPPTPPPTPFPTIDESSIADDEQYTTVETVVVVEEVIEIIAAVVDIPVELPRLKCSEARVFSGVIAQTVLDGSGLDTDVWNSIATVKEGSCDEDSGRRLLSITGQTAGDTVYDTKLSANYTVTTITTKTIEQTTIVSGGVVDVTQTQKQTVDTEIAAGDKILVQSDNVQEQQQGDANTLTDSVGDSNETSLLLDAVSDLSDDFDAPVEIVDTDLAGADALEKVDTTAMLGLLKLVIVQELTEKVASLSESPAFAEQVVSKMADAADDGTFSQIGTTSWDKTDPVARKSASVSVEEAADELVNAVIAAVEEVSIPEPVQTVSITVVETNDIKTVAGPTAAPIDGPVEVSFDATVYVVAVVCVVVLAAGIATLRSGRDNKNKVVWPCKTDGGGKRGPSTGGDGGVGKSRPSTGGDEQGGVDSDENRQNKELFNWDDNQEEELLLMRPPSSKTIRF